ncbi:MAG: helix-turn-helix domain-containing protein [Polyangiaceae bacterium]|nr:helix-turn-helix domain-containing protein [Myxococcales bacterium]MCB9588667.1 helix-turn-helix domain-containing protein [Polyangiaceae bacterium]MCB9605225.1 helix-turn-helix domain-containing protein [Polyangiaceae bacterium]
MTTRQVAELLGCGVKTVHNWVADGRIPHFRTPGRHLRFRAEDVAEFMRRSGFPVPDELSCRCPLLLVAEDARAGTLGLPRGAISLENPLDALVMCPSHRPLMVVVVAEQMVGVDLKAFRAAIDRACEDCRVVWVGSPPADAEGYELLDLLDPGSLASLLRVRRRDRPIP